MSERGRVVNEARLQRPLHSESPGEGPERQQERQFRGDREVPERSAHRGVDDGDAREQSGQLGYTDFVHEYQESRVIVAFWRRTD